MADDGEAPVMEEADDPVLADVVAALRRAAERGQHGPVRRAALRTKRSAVAKPVRFFTVRRALRPAVSPALRAALRLPVIPVVHGAKIKEVVDDPEVESSDGHAVEAAITPEVKIKDALALGAPVVSMDAAVMPAVGAADAHAVGTAMVHADAAVGAAVAPAVSTAVVHAVDADIERSVGAAMVDRV